MDRIVHVHMKLKFDEATRQRMQVQHEIDGEVFKLYISTQRRRGTNTSDVYLGSRSICVRRGAVFPAEAIRLR